MSSMQVGQRLVDLCREGRNVDAVDELYAEEVVSVEPSEPTEQDRLTAGKAAVRAKNVWFFENYQVHGGDLRGPYPHDNRFAVWFRYDVTPKATGQRAVFEEVGVYTVEKGRIVREEFYFAPPA